MWQYNKTNNLPGDSIYHSADELYHYGVLGMRWGHRKATAQAAKELRKAKWAHRKESFKSIKNLFKKSTYVAGVKNRAKNKKNYEPLNKARNDRANAAMKLIDAAAKDAYNKKLAKTGSKKKAQEASIKVHKRAMKKNQYGSGRVGSRADAKRRKGIVNGNAKYYNHLVKTKGKAYADKVERKYNNYTLKALAATGAVVIGYNVLKHTKLK